jgi:hypothetical protein
MVDFACQENKDEATLEDRDILTPADGIQYEDFIAIFQGITQFIGMNPLVTDAEQDLRS